MQARCSSPRSPTLTRASTRNDPNFTFGTGKLGDLAGFTSAIILAMIALLIAYEAVTRIFAPVPIHFAEAIPIACLGLAVNIASAWLLSGGGIITATDTGTRMARPTMTQSRCVSTDAGVVVLEVFETGVPPRFRLRAETGPALTAQSASVETVRPDGARQLFAMKDEGGYLGVGSTRFRNRTHSLRMLRIGQQTYSVAFEEHEHAQGSVARDNNMRAAAIHVIADAAVSVLVIVGLLLALTFNWLWMDPLAGIIGSVVIASWAYSLIRDTGAILLDMNPDQSMANNLRRAVENEGDEVADLHLWRLGPGHMGAIISIITSQARESDYYRSRLARFRSLSHLTVEIVHKS